MKQLDFEQTLSAVIDLHRAGHKRIALVALDALIKKVGKDTDKLFACLNERENLLRRFGPFLVAINGCRVG